MRHELVSHGITRYCISRADQDQLLAQSQDRAQRAIQQQSFKAEIAPVVPQKKGEPQHVTTDEYPRPGTTVEKLAGLSRLSKRMEGDGWAMRLGHQPWRGCTGCQDIVKSQGQGW